MLQKVSKSTTKYYTVLLRTTQCYSVLHSTTPYYKVLLRTTKYYTVLPRTTKYYTVLFRTTKYYTVLPRTTKYYTVLFRTTKYYTVLLRTTQFYKVLIRLIVATHETSFTMRGATEVTLQHHQILHLPRTLLYSTLFCLLYSTLLYSTPLSLTLLFSDSCILDFAISFVYRKFPIETSFDYICSCLRSDDGTC